MQAGKSNSRNSKTPGKTAHDTFFLRHTIDWRTRELVLCEAASGKTFNSTFVCRCSRFFPLVLATLLHHNDDAADRLAQGGCSENFDKDEISLCLFSGSIKTRDSLVSFPPHP